MKKKHINLLLLVVQITWLISSCQSRLYPSYEKSQTTGINSSISANVKADSIIAPYKRQLQNKIEEVIGTSESILGKDTLESPLGNYMNDAILQYIASKGEKVDGSILNAGGLRGVMPKGNVTVGDIFEILPFENELVIITLTSRQMQELFKKIPEKKNIYVGGMKLELDRKGNLLKGTIGNKTFEENKSYTILTIDYLANGGDNYTFMVGAPRKNLNIKIRDAIINHIKANPQTMIAGKKDKRVSLQ